MSKIPTDIIEKARSCWPSAREDAAPIHMAISRAILAERQRCADVARGATVKYEMDWRGEVEQPVLHRDYIAQAILAPVTT